MYCTVLCECVCACMRVCVCVNCTVHFQFSGKLSKLLWKVNGFPGNWVHMWGEENLLQLLMHTLNSLACLWVSDSGEMRERERESLSPLTIFLFHFFFAPMFYSPSISPLCSVLSPAYSGDVIARGPGRILGRFRRREASGTVSGRLKANIHPHKHTHICAHTHRLIFSPHTVDTVPTYTNCCCSFS